MSQEKVTIEQAVQRLSEASINNNTRLSEHEQKLTAIQIQNQEWQNVTLNKLEESQQQWTYLTSAVRELTNDIKKIAATITNDAHTQNAHHNDDNYSNTVFDQRQTSTPNEASDPSLPFSGSTQDGGQQSAMPTSHLQSSTQPARTTQTIIISPTSAIPLYHGNPSENPRQFLIRVKEYSETINHWNDNDLLNGISQFLRDTALEWYCQLRISNRRPLTWTEFTNTFLAQFNSPIRRAKQKQQWRNCKQNENETINEFLVRLRTLWSEQKPHETELDLVQHLLCKMRTDLLQLIGTSRNESLDVIVKEAQKAEEILYQRSRQLNDITYNAGSTRVVKSSFAHDDEDFSKTTRRSNKMSNATFKQNNYYPKNYNYDRQYYSNSYSSQRNTNQDHQRRFNNSPCMTCGIYGHSTNNCPGSFYNAYQPNASEYSSKNEQGARAGREDHAPI